MKWGRHRISRWSVVCVTQSHSTNRRKHVGNSTIRLSVLPLDAKRHRDLQSNTSNDVTSCSISRRLHPLMEWLQGENNPLYQMSLLQTGLWRWCCRKRETHIDAFADLTSLGPTNRPWRRWKLSLILRSYSYWRKGEKVPLFYTAVLGCYLKCNIYFPAAIKKPNPTGFNLIKLCAAPPLPAHVNIPKQGENTCSSFHVPARKVQGKIENTLTETS